MTKPPELLTTWEELLAEAAAHAEVDLEAFIHGAWAAYLAAHPGMREHLAELQLRADLDQLRKEGRMALA